MSAAPPPVAIFGNHFWVRFEEQNIGQTEPGGNVPLCNGAFSEITGLETTMTPFSISEGGRNRGQAQRIGPVMTSTVVLKRGVLVEKTNLYWWYKHVTAGAYAHRMNVIITVVGHNDEKLSVWRLKNAMPVKFKMADLNARATEIAIEELHLAHEGLELVRPENGR